MNLPANAMTPNIHQKFLEAESVRKQAIARRFGEAAKRYDEKAQVQKLVSKAGIKLLKREVEISTSYSVPNSNQTLVAQKRGVDIGCGTGFDTHRLLELCDNVTGVDLSPGMIEWAQEHHSDPSLSWLVADAEDLPFKSGRVDLVFSSMALQWLSDTQPIALECSRIMSKGARGVIAVVLKDSLFELYNSWLNLTDRPPVNEFFSANKWLIAFKNAGFNCSIESRDFVTYHKDVFDVLHSIKDVGAGVVMAGAKANLLKKTNLKLLNQMYKSEFSKTEQNLSGQVSGTQSKTLPLTWKIGFLQFEK